MDSIDVNLKTFLFFILPLALVTLIFVFNKILNMIFHCSESVKPWIKYLKCTKVTFYNHGDFIKGITFSYKVRHLTECPSLALKPDDPSELLKVADVQTHICAKFLSICANFVF